MALIDDMREGMISVDNLFTTQEMRDEAKLKKLHDIPIDQIDDFPDHPYKVNIDEDMFNLVDSIKEFGVLTPATVRQKEDGRYEMISGHRRKTACELAQMKTLKCEIVDLDRDAAILMMVDSNLQRTTILPSEKARAYKMRLDAMRRKAGRPIRDDSNSAPVGPNYRSNAQLAEEVNESATQIKRYIRLNELIPELLDMVDDNKIALRPAVEISYFPKDMQRALLENIEMEQCTPSHDQTLRMKKMLDSGKLTAEVITCIMQEEKPNQKEKLTIGLSKVEKYLPNNLPISKREEHILKALEFYRRYLERQERENSQER